MTPCLRKACLTTSLLCISSGMTWLPFRLLRNSLLTGDGVSPLPPFYPPCSDEEIVSSVTIVAVVKDTCSQVDSFFLRLAGMLPEETRVVYVSPEVAGCEEMTPLPVFRNTIRISAREGGSPFQAFLTARKRVKTPFSLLIHTDVVPTSDSSVCELVRALQTHPDAGIAAPHLLERGKDGVVVPHGHHTNLHIRSANGEERVSYDLDWDLLTRRVEADFGDLGGGPQMDFVEDHAFMARTKDFQLDIDPLASYTMEYIDVVLNVRWRGSHPWYVPTSHFLFDVDTNKLRWQDVPYFVLKRSEHEGSCVSVYLAAKWGVPFPHTSVWNYVRYSMLSTVTFEGNLLPPRREDQVLLFLSWFESVGFNTYSGDLLLSAAKRRRTVFDVARRRLPCSKFTSPNRSAHSVLKTEEHSELYRPYDVSLEETWTPISVSVNRYSTCRKETDCGMLVMEEKGGCRCYTFYPAFDTKSYPLVEWASRKLKLPSRAVDFLRMKHRKVSPSPKATYTCEKDSLACPPLRVDFKKGDRLLKWGWW